MNRPGERAITVLEITVALLLMTVIMAIGISPYITQQEMLKRQYARARIQDDISIILSYISRDVFLAESINRSVPSQLTVTIPNNPADISLHDTVVYRLGTGSHSIIRTLNGSNQTIISDPSSTNPTTYSLQFSGNDKNYLDIVVTGQRGGQAISMETSVALRATAAE